MNAVVLAAPAALVGAGFVLARWVRVAAPSEGRSPALKVLGVSIALPVATLVGLILLAKLFDSAVLGWMFGIGLLVCALAVPCAALVGLGWLLGRRRQKAPQAATLLIRLERDSVHASDDEGLDTWLAGDASTLLSALLAQVAASLPAISGGRATWVVETPTGTVIGVIAQQWTRAALAIPDRPVGEHFAGLTPQLRLRYRGQDEPSAVLEACRRQ